MREGDAGATADISLDTDCAPAEPEPKGQTMNPDSTSSTPARRRRSGLLIAGLTVGLATGVGVGLVVESQLGASQADAAQVETAPAGSRLPWDDSDNGDLSEDGSPDGRGRVQGMLPGRHSRMHEGMHPQVEGPGAQMLDRRRDDLRELTAIAARTIGITVEDLVAELKGGRSIADVATEKDVAVQDVIDALVDEVVKDATERITELVNRTPQAPKE